MAPLSTFSALRLFFFSKFSNSSDSREKKKKVLRSIIDFLFEFMLQSQMEELENKHTSEVAKLQKQIDALDNQIIRLQMSNSKRYAQYSYKTAPTILIFSIAMGAVYSFP